MKVLNINTFHSGSLVHEIKATDVLCVLCLLCISDKSKDNSLLCVNSLFTGKDHSHKENSFPVLHTHSNTNPPFSPKARPISSRGRSTGECQAATWRRRPDTPASSPRTGCCAPRCNRTLRTQSPRARRQESTCTITQTMQRMDTRCAPAPLTPPRLWAPAPPHLPSGCCHHSGRCRWPSALNCYDAKAWDKVPELVGGGPADTQSNRQLEYFVLII